MYNMLRQYRTKSVWRLCTPSACKFPVIFHKNAREYIKYSLRFLFHLTKNLTTHLSHNLCAVLPKETLHKARLTALHAICLLIFRHIAQKFLAIRQYACEISMQSAEKSDYAPYAQALCGVALTIFAPCPSIKSIFCSKSHL